MQSLIEEIYKTQSIKSKGWESCCMFAVNTVDGVCIKDIA